MTQRDGEGSGCLSSRSRLAVIALASAFAPMAFACGGALPRPTFSGQPTSALIAVAIPPPPGRVEVVPGQSKPQTVWVDGEWVWQRRRWAWLPGRWVQPPAHATFSPWVFVRGMDGRFWMAPGAWRDARGAALAPPTPVASAHVEAAQIVNSEADVVVTGPALRTDASGSRRGTPRNNDAGPPGP